MKTHELKITPQYFKDVIFGTKKFEVRLNDRDFQVGDQVILKEYVPPESDDELNFITQGHYTDDYAFVKIIYILNDQKYVKDGYVVFGFEVMATFRHLFKE